MCIISIQLNYDKFFWKLNHVTMKNKILNVFINSFLCFSVCFSALVHFAYMQFLNLGFKKNTFENLNIVNNACNVH